MKLSHKTLEEMTIKETKRLFQYKRFQNKLGNVKVYEMNEVLQSLDRKEGRPYCCTWKVMSMDAYCTIFQGINRYHSILAKCKYDCKGYEEDCKNYSFIDPQIDELIEEIIGNIK